MSLIPGSDEVRIYSQLDRSKLLHIMARSFQFARSKTNERRELCPDSPIKIAMISTRRNERLEECENPNAAQQDPQKCLIVVDGTVKVSYFDTDGTFLESYTLYAGDCSITLGGDCQYDSTSVSQAYEITN